MIIRQHSLRQKILISFLCVCLILLVFIFLGAVAVLNNRMNSNLSYISLMATQSFNILLDQKINELERMSSTFVNDTELARLLTQEKDSLLLRHMYHAIPSSDIQYRIFTKDGVEIKNSVLPARIKKLTGIQDIIQKTLKLQFTIKLKQSNDILAILSATPILNSDLLVQGVVILVHIIDRKLLDQMKVFTNAETAILYHDEIVAGDFLSIHKETWVPVFRSQLKGKENDVHSLMQGTFIQRVGASAYFFRYSALTDLDKKAIGSIIIALPMAEYQKTFRQTLLGLSIAAFLSLALSIVIGKLLADRISKPIVLLTDQVRTMGKGDSVTVDHINTGDEIETLADEFSRLHADLQESIRKSARFILKAPRHLLNDVARFS
ncbi:hypothetical protein ACFL27_16650 [candidate division CSSED10-310 bacterium]|uniref:histidine kinase n=1 Tax=candidate division CSSED10-310 bacterium TaxID=2855610 RepID=A0ABV6Z056_UNCC1